jgi:two-component system osmolarity sensor histidine kinase EnvZ
MRSLSRFFSWFSSGLFWRTFFYMALLVTASMLAWVSSYKIIEQNPRAEQKSAQIVSIVTITRAALMHSAPDKRRELLQDLARNEGIQIYLLEKEDRVVLQEQTDFFLQMKNSIRRQLDVETRFAKEVNGEEGFWISFNIAYDQYWLRLDQEKITPETGLQIMGWAVISLVLILFGALFITKLINDPLSRLSIAARLIAKGEKPFPLPEKGAKEIRETNASFNQMVEDLARIDSDRAIILAGISHDLRTPLTRMQLEVEMANLSSEARAGMHADLEQMDAIINQFLDYAKPLEIGTIESINISELLQHCVNEAKRFSDCYIIFDIESDLLLSGSVTDLLRMMTNIFENANRYGRNSINNKLKLSVSCKKIENEMRYGIQIQVRDHGAGVPEESMEEILRPFTRVNAARSQANGAGLGLAIVDRIVKRHNGKLQLKNHLDAGLIVNLFF